MAKICPWAIITPRYKSVEEEPLVELLVWTVMQEPDGAFYLIGVRADTGSLRQSTELVELDAELGIAKTASGRCYRLHGRPEDEAVTLSVYAYIQNRYLAAVADYDDAVQEERARRSAADLSPDQLEALLRKARAGKTRVDEKVAELLVKMQGGGTEAALEELFGIKKNLH